MTVPALTLYTRDDCCLCDKAEALIRKIGAEVPLTLTLVDIAGDEKLEAAYGTRIPVVALDGEVVLVSRVSEFWLRKILRGERTDRLSAL